MTMKPVLSRLSGIVLTLVLLLPTVHGQEPSSSPVKVACIDNSITYGTGIADRDRDSYPAVLGRLLGEAYDVRNFGFSARQLIQRGDLPYMKETMYQDVLRFQPDIAVIKLGTNDSKPQNWQYKEDFRKDLLKMLHDLDSLPSHPKIILCYPAKAYAIQWGINDSIITHGIIPVIRQVAAEKRLPVIDLHTATSHMEEHFPDKIHPDPTGAALIARKVYEKIKEEKW